MFQNTTGELELLRILFEVLECQVPQAGVLKHTVFHTVIVLCVHVVYIQHLLRMGSGQDRIIDPL